MIHNVRPTHPLFTKDHHFLLLLLFQNINRVAGENNSECLTVDTLRQELTSILASREENTNSE